MSLPVLDRPAPPPATGPDANGGADTDPFASAKTLLIEATAAVAEFRAACATFVREAACTKVSTKQPKTGFEQVKVAVRQQPPMRLRTLAFTVAYKLRRALDQAAIASAVELGCEGRSGGFPFGPSAATFELVVVRDCHGYDPRLIAHMRAMKPYGGEGGDELLFALAGMAGAQRNQLTIGLGLDTAKVKVETLVGQLTGPGEIGNFGWDRKKRELHIATLQTEDSEAVVSINTRTRLPLIVEMGGPAAFGDREACSVLVELVAKAEAVVHDIEQATARLKASSP